MGGMFSLKFAMDPSADFVGPETIHTFFSPLATPEIRIKSLV